MNRICILALALVLAAPAFGQRITGLSNWSIVLDPGHSENENQGVFGYSEANKVLAVGLELRALLLGLTDISAVFMTRTNATTQVGLTERSTYANTTGAAYFHSIHSNAAAPEATGVFVLWPQDPATLGEPPASGGRLVARTMGPLLSRSMRIPATGGGAYGECDFYGVASCRTLAQAPKASRNSVQSFTTMPSTLSEAGFHTNPTQNQRNMSRDWKRMEARTMFYSFLKVRGVARPAARIVMGIASDIESGVPVNGAVVTFGGRSDTTDTYLNTFRFYSNNPDELHNGFFYLEDVAAGTGTLSATAPGFRSASTSVTPVDTFFTIQDLGLVSTAPFTVATAAPANGATGFRIIDPVVLTFSRPADTASVRAAFSLRPVGGGAALPGSFTWTSGNRRLSFQPAQTLGAFTQYEVAVAAGATSPYGFALDANGDGTPGDAVSVRFTTGPQDITAPSVAGLYPANNGRNVELFPLLNVAFDEEVIASSYQTSAITLTRTSDGAPVTLFVRPSLVNGATVLHIVPGAVLAANTFYRLSLPAGMADRFGNAVANVRNITFQTGTVAEDRTYIEQFEGTFTDNWWLPTQSGSTTQASLVVDSTGMAPSATGNPLTGSTKAMQVRFGFKTDASNWLIREYLNSGPAFAARFDTSYTLQTYVHGDGSGVLFRFAVDDNCATGCGTSEVSPWIPITWRGWRKVEWDLGSTPPGTWIGNGSLDGTLRFDSYQLSYTPGSPAFGRLLFDDLAVVKTRLITASEEAPAPGGLMLNGIAPNPVGARATVRFRLDAAAPVTLDVYDALGRRVARLVDGETLTPGPHERTWDASDLAPGVYVVRLTAGATTRTATAVVGR